MLKPRFVLPSLIVILLTLAVGLGTAGAHQFRSESSVSIRYNEDKTQFQGRVRAHRPRCERRRSVVVLRVRPRRDAIAGADLTNRNGHYSVEKRNPKGDFFAHVARRVTGRGNHRHICRGDTSKTITVG